ncbi:unnamed protein product [Rotaria magnacalcarata]|uniref:Uncharacterized protein n=1 Tax=Rotaria magnacalcarata TaxID=392030 RepID=A0A814I021_9BILA|nr:unnamed protein product [Rotaria magnacalcarata]CAF1625310.1 unnamed protein product [Rotaria magnacalcarata]CAF2109307.1 unnamed protein product [Rotaria magnacalcarata]CAF3840528.1 unnamed protein product [Rotaria magnacalcarata]CAF3895213.1 unnamed protein product [Rotaria magnacalcarata]
MNSYSASEQTRRLLSPYNQDCYKLYNLNLRSHFKRMKIILNQIMNDLNSNLYSSKSLFEINIDRKKIFKINKILTQLHNKRFMFDNKNNSFFLYLRNSIYILMKYLTQFEICIHEIDLVKKHFNQIITSNGIIEQYEQDFIRKQLTYIVNKVQNDIQNKSYDEQANFLMSTFDILCNVRSKRDLYHRSLRMLNFDSSTKFDRY